MRRMDMSTAAAQHGRPDLLTQDEAITVLRLDCLGLKDPKESLRHMRRTGQLAFVKVAGKVLIPRGAIDDYLARRKLKPNDEAHP